MEQKKPQLDDLVRTAESLRESPIKQQIPAKGKNAALPLQQCNKSANKTKYFRLGMKGMTMLSKWSRSALSVYFLIVTGVFYDSFRSAL